MSRTYIIGNPSKMRLASGMDVPEVTHEHFAAEPSPALS